MRHGILMRRVRWRGEEMSGERQFSRSAYLGVAIVGVSELVWLEATGVRLGERDGLLTC